MHLGFSAKVRIFLKKRNDLARRAVRVLHLEVNQADDVDGVHLVVALAALELLDEVGCAVVGDAVLEGGLLLLLHLDDDAAAVAEAADDVHDDVPVVGPELVDLVGERLLDLQVHLEDVPEEDLQQVEVVAKDLKIT